MSKTEANIQLFLKNLKEKSFSCNNFMQKQLNNATPHQFLALFSSSDKFTCVFAGELVFFFLPLFSFGVRYFYQLRGVSFSQPHTDLSSCLPVAVLLSAFLAFVCCK